MPHTSHHFVRRTQPARNPTLTRFCIGVLGLFPMVTGVLMTVVHNRPIAIVMAGLGAVTIMSLLPRGDGPKS